MMRSGFSLVEVVIGMLIFAVGVLVLSASTGYMGLQIRAADLRTERSAAFQQAAEQLQAMPFDSIKTVASGDAVDYGEYATWWDVSSINWALKEVQVYSEGPGFATGVLSEAARDTLVLRIARPVR